MSKNLKRERASKEHERLLKEVEKIDAMLEGKSTPEDAANLLDRFSTGRAFSESVSWLNPLIEDSLSDIQVRLDKLVDALEQEFPTSYSVENQSEEEQGKFMRRMRASAIVNHYIDSALILYALGRNGAALIDLHAAVERQSIETLAEQMFLPEKREIGLQLLERKTLKEFSRMLQDCNLINDEDVKYAERLNRLRNGLAHRNAKVISNVVFSGEELLQIDIDSVMSDVDYIPYMVGAINFLIKITEWNEEPECSVCHEKL